MVVVGSTSVDTEVWVTVVGGKISVEVSTSVIVAYEVKSSVSVSVKVNVLSEVVTMVEKAVVVYVTGTLVVVVTVL